MQLSMHDNEAMDIKEGRNLFVVKTDKLGYLKMSKKRLKENGLAESNTSNCVTKRISRSNNDKGRKEPNINLLETDPDLNKISKVFMQRHNEGNEFSYLENQIPADRLNHSQIQSYNKEIEDDNLTENNHRSSPSIQLSDDGTEEMDEDDPDTVGCEITKNFGQTRKRVSVNDSGLSKNSQRTNNVRKRRDYKRPQHQVLGFMEDHAEFQSDWDEGSEWKKRNVSSILESTVDGSIVKGARRLRSRRMSATKLTSCIDSAIEAGSIDEDPLMVLDNWGIKSEHHKYKCSYCEVVSSKQADIQHHIAESKDTHSDAVVVVLMGTKALGRYCSLCNVTFQRKDYFKHVREKHSDMFQFQCGYCDFSGCDVNQIRHHIQKKHDTKKYAIIDQLQSQVILRQGQLPVNDLERFSDEEENPINSENGSLICPLCKKILKNLRNLKKHLVQHSRKKQQCTLCPFTTNFPTQIRSHYRCKHKNAKPEWKEILVAAEGNETLVEDISPYLQMVTQKYGVRKPSNTEHKRQYSCPHCDYTCNFNSSYNRHLGVHRGIKTFKCGYCDYHSRESYLINKHSAKVHKGKEVIVEKGKNVKAPYRYEKKLMKKSCQRARSIDEDEEETIVNNIKKELETDDPLRIEPTLLLRSEETPAPSSSINCLDISTEDQTGQLKDQSKTTDNDKSDNVVVLPASSSDIQNKETTIAKPALREVRSSVIKIDDLKGHKSKPSNYFESNFCRNDSVDSRKKADIETHVVKTTYFKKCNAYPGKLSGKCVPEGKTTVESIYLENGVPQQIQSISSIDSSQAHKNPSNDRIISKTNKDEEVVSYSSTYSQSSSHTNTNIENKYENSNVCLLKGNTSIMNSSNNTDEHIPTSNPKVNDTLNLTRNDCTTKSIYMTNKSDIENSIYHSVENLERKYNSGSLGENAKEKEVIDRRSKECLKTNIRKNEDVLRCSDYVNTYGTNDVNSQMTRIVDLTTSVEDEERVTDKCSRNLPLVNDVITSCVVTDALVDTSSELEEKIIIQLFATENGSGTPNNIIISDGIERLGGGPVTDDVNFYKNTNVKSLQPQPYKVETAVNRALSIVQNFDIPKDNEKQDMNTDVPQIQSRTPFPENGSKSEDSTNVIESSNALPPNVESNKLRDATGEELKNLNSPPGGLEKNLPNHINFLSNSVTTLQGNVGSLIPGFMKPSLADDCSNKQYYSMEKIRLMMKKQKDGKVKCLECGVTTTQRAFYKHAKRHFNLKPFKCGHCTYRAMERSKVRVHNSFCHSDKPCSIFKLSPEDSIVTVKPTISSSNDDIVTKQIPKNSESHQRITRISSNSDDVQTTRSSSHIQEGTKKRSMFQCPLCSKTLKIHSPTIRRHLYSHFGFKPFKCGYCSYTAIGATEICGHHASHGSDKAPKIELSGASLSEEQLQYIDSLLNLQRGNKRISHKKDEDSQSEFMTKNSTDIMWNETNVTKEDYAAMYLNTDDTGHQDLVSDDQHGFEGLGVDTCSLQQSLENVDLTTETTYAVQVIENDTQNASSFTNDLPPHLDLGVGSIQQDDNSDPVCVVLYI